jgi:hypothetical protein
MKRLACIFGRHRWTTHVEHGNETHVCSRCGRVLEDDLSKELEARHQMLLELQERGGKISGGNLPGGDIGGH